MASEITIPKSSRYHGTLTQWFKTPGDPVRKGEILFEITSDVAAEKFPAAVSGRLASILRNEGDAVTGGNILGQIEESEENVKANQPDVIKAVETEEATFVSNEPVTEEEFKDISIDDLMHYIKPFDLTQATAALQAYYVRETKDRFEFRDMKAGRPTVPFKSQKSVIRAMPSARVLAKSHGIQLIDLVNCGVRGCITKKDVERFIEQRRIFEKQQKEKRDAEFSEQMASYNNAEPVEAPELKRLHDDLIDENQEDEPKGETAYVSLSSNDEEQADSDALSVENTDRKENRDKPVKMSHLAKNIAKKNQIAVGDSLNGSGAHGRILKSDITTRVTEDGSEEESASSNTSIEETTSREELSGPSYTLDPATTLKESDHLRLNEEILLNDYLIDDFKSLLDVNGYRYHNFAKDTEVAVLTGDIDITFLKKFRKNISKSFEAETGLHCTSTDLWLTALARAFCDVSTKKSDVNIALMLKNNDFIVTPVMRRAEEMTLRDIVASRVDYISGVKCNRYDKKVYLGADATYFNLSRYGTDILALPLTASGTPVISTGAPKDKTYGLTKKTVVTLSLTVLPDWISFGKAFARALSAYISEPDLLFKS